MAAFRIGGISYLRIPAPDPRAVAQFYGSVFGWEVDLDREDPSFSDGSGDVIGHFRRDLPVAGGAGVIPYVYVADVDAVTERVLAGGGTIETAPYPEGSLTVAVFNDPAGNRVGVWQQSSRP